MTSCSAIARSVKAVDSVARLPGVERVPGCKLLGEEVMDVLTPQRLLSVTAPTHRQQSRSAAQLCAQPSNGSPELGGRQVIDHLRAEDHVELAGRRLVGE